MARVAQWVRSLDLPVTAHTSLSLIQRGFVPGFINYKKGCTRLAASDQVYKLLSQGRWFSLGTPTSSTTKTGRHDIAESGVKHQKFKFKLHVPYYILPVSHSLYIRPLYVHIRFLLNNCSAPSANHLKFIHKVSDHKRKVKFNFGLDHFSCYGVLPIDLSKKILILK